MYDNILEKIKKTALSKNISISKVIGASDMSEKGFYLMFKNESIKIKALHKISEVLDVPITYFFGDETINVGPGVYVKGVQQNGQNNTAYVSERCEEMQAQIDALKEAIQAKNELIEMLKKQLKE